MQKEEISINSGVYKILNKINGKFYIGSSTRLSIRNKEHFRLLRTGIHGNAHLQYSYNKYGRENFVYEIVEFCDSDKCIEREQYYINLLEPKYNICPLAGTCKGRILSDTHKKLIGKSNKNKIRSNELKERWSIIAKDRINKNRSNWNKVREKAAIKNSKPIIQYTLDGTVIREWKSAKEAEEYLKIDRSLIGKVCRGKISHTHNLIFKFK